MVLRASARIQRQPAESPGQKLLQQWQQNIGNEGDNVTCTFPPGFWNQDPVITAQMRRNGCECPSEPFQPTGHHTKGQLPKIQKMEATPDGKSAIMRVIYPPVYDVPIKFQDGTTGTVNFKNGFSYYLEEQHVADYKVKKFPTLPERQVVPRPPIRGNVGVPTNNSDNWLQEDIPVTLRLSSIDNKYTNANDTLRHSPEGWYVATTLEFVGADFNNNEEITSKTRELWFYWDGDQIKGEVSSGMPWQILSWYAFFGCMVLIHLAYLHNQSTKNSRPFDQVLWDDLWGDWLLLAGIAIPSILVAFYHWRPNFYTTHNSRNGGKVVKSLLHFGLMGLFVLNLDFMFSVYWDL